MRLLKKMRRQWAVYWPPAGTDSHGRIKYGPPVEMKVRWVDSTEVFKNAKGVEQVSKAKVYFGAMTADGEVVEVRTDGVFWRGPNLGLTPNPLAALDDDHQKDPFKNQGAWAVAVVDVTPTMKANDFLRKAYL